ncbi:MAG: LUD domain-containing protein [Syntrophobacteraceae bacterium]
MSRPERVERYIRMARIAGTVVECVSRSELPLRLTGVLGDAGEPKIAALSATGWPESFRQSIEAIVASSGFEVTMPCKGPAGYTWDMGGVGAASVGLVWCEHFLADTGSLVLATGQGRGGLSTLLPPISIVLSDATGCLEGLVDYFEQIGRSLPSRLTLVTGPSCTGDIEAAMTRGVHGPQKVVHFILCD